MAKITEIPNECPQCGGPIWDNTKREKRNPKAPDAACRDKDHCRWAGWLPEGQKGQKGTPKDAQQYPWGPLLKLCVQYVEKEIRPLFTNPPATNEMVKELAVSLFITASNQRGDIFKKVAPAPTPVAPPPPPPPPVAEYDDSDDGLPF